MTAGTDLAGNAHLLGSRTDHTAGGDNAVLAIKGVLITGINELTITSAITNVADGGTFTTSDVSVSRGIHAPTAATATTSSTLAADALKLLETALEGVNSTRAQLGASMSRLDYTARNLQNVSQNSSAARSRLLDADYVNETAELARAQIIQ